MRLGVYIVMWDIVRISCGLHHQRTLIREVAKACKSEDLEHRINLQNKLTGICRETCRGFSAYVKCSECVDFTARDTSLGVLLWEDLINHLGVLVQLTENIMGSPIKPAKIKPLNVSLPAFVSTNSRGVQHSLACQQVDLKRRTEVRSLLDRVFGGVDRNSSWEDLLVHIDRFVMLFQTSFTVFGLSIAMMINLD